MWEIAPEFGALLVFAEHRYYGQSQPYGNKSFSVSHSSIFKYSYFLSFIFVNALFKINFVIYLGFEVLGLPFFRTGFGRLCRIDFLH